MTNRIACLCLGAGLVIASHPAPGYAAEVLRLDFENGANLAEDTSGNAIPGAIEDVNFFGVLDQSADARPGSPGTSSASFSPADFENGRFIRYADADFPDFGPTDDFTIRFWVNPTANFLADGQGFRGVLSGLSEVDFTGLDWQIDNGASVGGGSGDGSTTFSRFSGPVDFDLGGADLIADTWQEITLTYHAGPRNALVFIDGEFSNAASVPGGLSMGTLLVGTNRNVTRVYEGLMDDLVVTDTPIVIDDSGVARDPGDLDFDGDLDIDDYLALRVGQGTDLSALNAVAAYQQGDIDFDGDSDIDDFIGFKELFISANGPLAFSQLFSVPEPSAAALLGLAAFLGMRTRRRRTAEPVKTNPTHRQGTTPMKTIGSFKTLSAAAMLALGGAAHGQAIVFDFGNGDVDGGTGVAANFVVPDASALGPLTNTQGGVELSITGITSNGPGTYDSNSQGFGIVSVDDTNNASQQRRLDTTNDGETVQFSFDSDVTLSSTRIGSLASADEGFSLSFVSGVDPFAGGSFTFTTTDGGVTETGTFDIPLGDVSVTAGTVLEFSTLNEGGGGILWNDLRVLVGEPVVPLTLQVLSNGEMKLLGGNPGGLNPESFIEIDAIQITSEDALADGGSLNAAGFTGIAGDAGFPTGDGSGNGWEPGLSNSDTFISEAFLLGSSQIPNDAEISLGTGYVPGGEQDITFVYREVGQSVATTGLVEFIDVGDPSIPGDFDGDGDVDGVDLGVFAFDFAQSPQGGPPFAQSDFDMDGDVDGVDLGVFSFSFANFPPAAAAVPEPASALLVICVTVAASCSRKR